MNELKDDIYFSKNFPKLYEKIEDGKATIFNVDTDYGRIEYNYILRKIPINVDKYEYYDIITPYGYGGPRIFECKNESKKEYIVNYFYKQFKNYCYDNNIVSEFVRFHPLFNNAMEFKNIYSPIKIRKTIGTNLKKYPNFLSQEYSKGCRKSIRQALNKGITYIVEENVNDLSEFKDIYYSTMNRNKASDYYYFDDEYFNKCLKYYKKNIILVKAIYNEKVIAEGFYFIWNKIVHIHLSGTLNEFLYLSPAYVLRYAVTEWAVKNGYELIHHGGGRTNDTSDSLFLFKKQFGKNTEFDFYVGKKIWNERIYNRLIEGLDDKDDFFPLYRKRYEE